MTYTKAKQIHKNKEPKEKKQRFRQCRYCKEKTVPYGAIQPFCFKGECIQEHNRRAKEKKKREAKQNDKSYLIVRADYWFNRYIRLYRDRAEPCISCQRPAYKLKKINAGHYRPKGRNAQHRYNEDNVHKQCEPCNSSLSGNIENYRPNLIKKIGLDRVIALEEDNSTKHYTVEELKSIIELYKQKCKTSKEKHETRSMR